MSTAWVGPGQGRCRHPLASSGVNQATDRIRTGIDAPPEGGDPAAYVFSLDYADARNWDLCKAAGIVGVRRNLQGQTHARALRVGDVLYVWRGGGAKPGSGLIARATVTGPAVEAGTTEVPWPDPGLFTYVVPFELDEELPEAIADSFPDHRKGLLFKIQNTSLQKGLMPVSDESRLLLEARFATTGTPDGLELVPVAVGRAGWSTDQDLIRETERAAVAAARAFLSESGWREVRDCQLDGCGYDFVFEHGDGRQRLVEVKGTESDEVRFQLTRLEHDVISTDPRGRVYAVTRALSAPRVHVLDWTDVEDLGVKPASWQVG